MKKNILSLVILGLGLLFLSGCSHFNRKISNDWVDENGSQTNYVWPEQISQSANSNDAESQGVASPMDTSDAARQPKETTQILDSRQIESMEAAMAQDEKKLCIYDEMIRNLSEPLESNEDFTICINAVDVSQNLSDLADITAEDLFDVFDKTLIDENGHIADGWMFLRVSGDVTFHRDKKYNVLQWNLVAASEDTNHVIKERPELAYTNLVNGDGRYKYYYEFIEDENYDFVAIYVLSEDVYEHRTLFFNPGYVTFPQIGDGPNESHVIRLQ